MKICILGGGGNLGRRLVATAVAQGHDVTALVRRLPDTPAAASALHYAKLDFEDDRAIAKAVAGHDVVINTAGHISDRKGFAPLVQRIVRAADQGLGPGGRFWMLAGAAILDIPGTKRMGLDLPGVPTLYEDHRANLETVRATRLDWSVLCPGPMIDAPDGQATPGLVVSSETWPIAPLPLARWLPAPALSLAFVSALPRMTIYYEDAASVILANLERQGASSRQRIGVALPGGLRRTKPRAT
jgi:putative NADH-flavin reductase